MTAIAATTTTANRPDLHRRTEPGPLTLRSVSSAADERAWAAFVDAHPDGTLFHHPDWAAAVARCFGHQPLHQLAWRGDAVVGVLPLMAINSIFAGRILDSMPYATYGGLLASDAEAREALTGAALRLVYDHGARQLTLRSATAVVADLPTDERYCCFRRALPTTLDELKTYLPRKARAAARQAAERDGLTVTHDQQLLRTVYGLYARSMRRLGSVNYSLRFFETLVERLGSRAWVSVAWQDGRPIAGLLSFVYRDTVMPYFLGADERVRGTGSTNLLYYAVMERAVQAGLATFDFGRTRRENVGAFAFKRNQGFEPQPLGYQRFVPPGLNPPDLSPTNPRFSLARRVWQRLPLFVTRPVGAWVAKSVAG